MKRYVLDRIAELGRRAEEPKFILDEGRRYCTRKLELMTPPTANPLLFTSLAGLTAYVLHGPDRITPYPMGELVSAETAQSAAPPLQPPVTLHVSAYNQVSVISGHVGPAYDRHVYATAKPESIRFAFDTWVGHESFMIGLLSLFVQDGEMRRFQELAGSLTADEIRTVVDNGITQEVTAKAGVAQKERVTIPNPIRLAPFRTFMELAQPSSLFVFRVRQNPATKVLECALFEADGGAWKLDAMDRVVAWLRGALPEAVVLG